MRVMVIGGGAREHALCWKLSASPLVERLLCAPGNAGIAEIAECVAISVDAIDQLVEAARAARIDFVVVGPEQPLVAGLVDRMEAAGIAAFGPSAAAARLEGSKAFLKQLCAEARIPTAEARICRSYAEAHLALDAFGLPVVVKVDGLAAGKGVVIAQTRAEAEAAVKSALCDGRFGHAGEVLVIERFLDGPEVSFFALADGARAIELQTACDYKRAHDGNHGPNTGGMGAYAPAPIVDATLRDRVMAEIIHPTVAAMRAAGTPFKGVLYAGLILTREGPRLLEYNVRFGDPECQVLMALMKSDLLPALIAAREGVLDRFDLRWREEVAVTVVHAAKGYPETGAKGEEIFGIAAAASVPDVTVFQAGTRRDGDRILADGGRILSVTATGADYALARGRAYDASRLIAWPGGRYRSDIALAVERRC